MLRSANGNSAALCPMPSVSDFCLRWSVVEGGPEGCWPGGGYSCGGMVGSGERGTEIVSTTSKGVDWVHLTPNLR